RLVEERRQLEVEHARVEHSLQEVQTSPAKLRTHEIARRWWGMFFSLALGIAGASAWWSISWYMTLGWEKVLLASTIVVLPLIGWCVLLRYLEISEIHRRQLMAVLAFVIILGSLLAAASFTIGRATGTGFVEGQQSTSGQEGDLDRSVESSGNAVRAERIK